jgi:hypothetical protein
MVEEVEEDSEKIAATGWGRAAKVSLGVLGGLSLLMGYISAAGMKESERESEARKPIDDFVTALNARNLEAGRKTLHYPHIQIAGNELSILENPESFQIDFQSLSSEGWSHSTLDSCAMRQSCDEKVHFEVQLSMHRANNTRYATYQALWVVTRKEGNWGIQCRSIFPSGVRLS